MTHSFRASREETILHVARDIAAEYGPMAGYTKEAQHAYVDEKLKDLPRGLSGLETARWVQSAMSAQLLNEAGW